MGETKFDDIGHPINEAMFLKESLLRAMVANAPVGVYLTDINGQCQYANQTWCEMAGMPLEEALGNGWINAIYPEDRERISAARYRLDASEWAGKQEYRFQTNQGKVFWVAGYATKLLDGKGSVVGYFGINIDISSIKNLETALRASEERYRTTIDAMSDGIHVVDKNLVITLNNSTIARWAQEMGLSNWVPSPSLPYATATRLLWM